MANQATITTASVDRFLKDGVADGKPHATLRDGRLVGLSLRLLRSGTATWQFVYRVRGTGRASTQRFVTLGRWPSTSVDAAKIAAKKLAGQVADGQDPRIEIREAARRERATVSVAIDQYETWLESRKLKKTATAVSALRRGLASLANRDLAELDRRAFVDCIERIERDGRPGAARDLRKFSMSFLERQVSLGTISVNPLAGHRMPALSRDDRVAQDERRAPLTEDEIRRAWNAATKIGGSFGLLVRTGLLTGLRRSELAALRWDWIDRAAGRITIPAGSMKSGKAHIVVITPLVADLLDKTPNRGAGLVFPSERRHGGATPISGWSQLVAALRKASGIEGFAMHTLRRTFRSILADLGVAEAVAEAMVAHARPDLIQRYARGDLWDLRRAAALAYDLHIAGLIAREDGAEAANVVKIGTMRVVA